MVVNIAIYAKKPYNKMWVLMGTFLNVKLLIKVIEVQAELMIIQSILISFQNFLPLQIRNKIAEKAV